MIKKYSKIAFIILILTFLSVSAFAEDDLEGEISTGAKIGIAIASLTTVSILLGLGLSFASQKLAVEKDEKIVLIEEALPGANCGACGYPGCSGYAAGIVNDSVEINLCTPGGNSVAKKIAKITGQEAAETEKQVARIHCKGDNDLARQKFIYNGMLDCHQASTMFDGFKACPYGCLGLGSCVRACPFEAVHINVRGIAQVDEEKCTGCGKCVEACPKGIISLMPESCKVYVACSSKDKAKQVGDYCNVGCTGCKRCVKAAEDGAIDVKSFLAKVNPEKWESAVPGSFACPNDCFVLLMPQNEIDQAKQKYEEEEAAKKAAKEAKMKAAAEKKAVEETESSAQTTTE